MVKKLALVCILFLSYCATACADSAAFIDLNWSGATFSGPIAPIPPPPVPGTNTFVEFVTTLASATQDSPTILTGSHAATWIPLSSTASPVGGVSATATLDSLMTASSTQASHTGFASSNVERLGTITTTTTAVNISIPYTFGTKETLNSDGTLDSASASAEIVLWQGNGPVSEVNIDFAGLDVPGETSGSGILTLNAQQLTPGPHVFFIDGEADAKAVFLPEPSTIAMLCTGLLALIGFSLLRGLTSTWS